MIKMLPKIIAVNKKIISSVVMGALLFSQAPLVFAQMPDMSAPTMDTTPVEETITPPADTTGPAFISVATASAEETEVNVMWTTDELSYGFVEYGETTSYGLSTPKSTASAMDHMVAVNGLAPGTTYHYRIVAQDESGNISYSQDRTFDTAVEVVAMDNVPPQITQVSASNITASGATISWITDELAQGRVEYGKTPVYGSMTSLASDYATEHSAALAGIEANTEYHFRVVVQDESGNAAVSPDEVFITDALAETSPAEEPATTEPAPSTATTTTTIPPTTATSTSATATTASSTSTTATSTPPTTATTTVVAIFHVETAAVGTSTATIIWNTSEPATSQVFYGAGETYASSSPVSGAQTTAHEIKLIGLKPGTNYFYKVVSRNAAGVIIEKSGFEFTTLYQQKKIVKAPPVISSVAVSFVGTSTASIVWDTDVPAAGEVRYGTTTAYGTSDGGHKNLLTAHLHNLSGLLPNTRYHFVAIVRDAYGNETIYENKSFTTLKDSSQASAPVAEGAAASAEPITDQTTVAPAIIGGGHYSYTRTTTLAAPKFTKVEALDGQVMFVWQAQKPRKAAPGSTSIGTNIIIVRNANRYAEDPTFGTVIYKGDSGLFTDVNLENNTTYYYSVFAANQFNSHSRPTRFAVMPVKTQEETVLEAVPPFVQKTPIYTFPKILSRGDRNKHVEHLQVVLASASSFHPSGLITGFFGPLTESAVKKFQKSYSLLVTGVADGATLKKIERLSSIEVVQDKAMGYDSVLARDLALGGKGDDVSALQQFLADVGVYPDALVTGYFGPATKSAVQRFQQAQNIAPASGYFGSITKKRMLNLIRLRGVSLSP